MAARRITLPGFAVVLAGALVPLGFGPAAHASNPAIVVNSAADPGDGTCDGTQCTLHEAIAKANADAGADEIDFAIPDPGVHTIFLTTPLPAITEQLTIDGSTQGSNAHLIAISGQNAGSSDGLQVQAAGSVIRGISIGDVHGNSVVVTADDVTVAGNLIGVAPDGNGFDAQLDGVLVQDAIGVVIGGTTAADRNVISDSGSHGVAITGSTSFGNLIEGNFIGTAIDGTAGFGNNGDGVFVSDAPSTTIGGTTAGARNVISGNGEGGVFADGIHGIAITGSGATGTFIEGNFIGTDATGTVAVGNAGNGVFTTGGASGTTIGGTAAGAGNLLSGNDEGIVLFSTADTRIQGDRIGTTADGMSALPNRVGVGVEGPGVTIGGTAGGAGNVISGNTLHGIDIQSAHAVIQGNLIGTAADGKTALGNGGDGIHAGDLTNGLIGGSVPGAGNVVAASGVDGMDVGGAKPRIQGNFVGTDRTGTRSLGNDGNGILLDGSSGATVGGTTARARNVVKHNGFVGILVKDFGSPSIQDRIRQNLVVANGGLGIDLGGDGVTPNDAHDADTGTNELQNFPVVRSAIHHNANTTLQLVLHSAASTKYAIDLFSSGSCDPSGHGEGASLLRSLSVTTDGTGSFVGTTLTPRARSGT